MSKTKSFLLHAGESLIKSGTMDYIPEAGVLNKSYMGNVYLTTKRFFYKTNKRQEKIITIEIPVDELVSAKKIGNVFTHRLQISTEQKDYCFGVFPMGGWLKALSSVIK